VSPANSGQFVHRDLKKAGCTTFCDGRALLDEPWCSEFIDEVFALPRASRQPAGDQGRELSGATRDINRLATASIDYDVELVAPAPRDIRGPGRGGETKARISRQVACAPTREFRGIRIPTFVHCLNTTGSRRGFLRDVPAVRFKPRKRASALGSRSARTPTEVWQRIEDLGDMPSNYLLEQRSPGEISRRFDSYPRETWGSLSASLWLSCSSHHEGGIFSDKQTTPREIHYTRAARHPPGGSSPRLDFVRGVAPHGIIAGDRGWAVYFLEDAARVGGAHIADLVEVDGSEPLSQWEKGEIAQGGGRNGHTSHRDRPDRDLRGGLIVSLPARRSPNVRL